MCRLVHKRSAIAQKTLGLKGKLLSKKRHAEKATMKKTIAMHQERDNKHKAEDNNPQSALPAYLLEREQVRSFSIGKLTLARYSMSTCHLSFIAYSRS